MVPSTRVYRSELRERQAEQTRARIIASAAKTFSEQGYQSTTMAAIARGAGVSTETVKAAGTKAELLITAFEVTFAGTEGGRPFPETELGAGLLDLADDVFVGGVVERVVKANARSFALWTVLVAAALSDPVVDAALSEMLARRRESIAILAQELTSRGIAHGGDSGSSPEALADVLSFLVSPEGYQQLVSQSGWSEQRYTDWVRQAVLTARAG